MKKYYCENQELNELLISNGIDLICDDNMDIIISDEDCERINDIVMRLAPSAIDDYYFD